MVDRERLEALLANRFPGTSREQIAAAANAIMAMIRDAEREPTEAPVRRQRRNGAASALPRP